MISPASIYIILKGFLARFFNGLSGRTFKGIKNRIVLAFSLAVIGMITDSLLVYTNYNYIPTYVGANFGWDYLATGMEHKSMFWSYELERIIGLAIFTATGWLIYRTDKTSITRFRVFCLLEETANLIILTYVGISIVILFISLGDNTQKISEKWELVTMGFWFCILLVEFIYDLRYFRQQKHGLQNSSDCKA